MNIEDIIARIQHTYPGLVEIQSWGETGLFYNPEGILKRGIYFLTLKEHDGANDTASALNRNGVYRLNLGISKTSFYTLFGEQPKRPAAGGVVAMDYDFTTLDTILPHPVYGWMSWISVLNPSLETFSKLEPLLEEGYQLAIKKYKKRLP